MNKEISFTIPGEPQGKARARVVRLPNGMSRSYTPEKTVLYENWIRTCYQQAGGAMLQDGPKEVNIFAYFHMPKTSKTKIAAMLNGQIRPTGKRDIDNIAKCVGDALNGIAWKDDSCIVTLHAEKWYGEISMMKVQILLINTVSEGA